LHAYIRLACKNFPGANVPAYFGATSDAKKKSLMLMILLDWWWAERQVNEILAEHPGKKFIPFPGLNDIKLYFCNLSLLIIS
jgi:hypothetical protein